MTAFILFGHKALKETLKKMSVSLPQPKYRKPLHTSSFKTFVCISEFWNKLSILDTFKVSSFSSNQWIFLLHILFKTSIIHESDLNIHVTCILHVTKTKDNYEILFKFLFEVFLRILWCNFFPIFMVLKMDSCWFNPLKRRSGALKWSLGTFMNFN